MSKLYIITNTVGDDQFSIQPGALNGPGGTQASTDLRLYGQGATNYGEGVNENLYRITESFACPEKAGTPGVPQDEADLGVPGAGINNPVAGQVWFNTSTGRLLVYDDNGASFGAIGSAESSASEPTAPASGDLWYDTNVPQLKVYDGTAFFSVADRYLEHGGGNFMTGNLNMDAGSPVNNRIVNLADPVDPQDGTTKNYVDTELSNAISGTIESTYLRLDGTNGPVSGDLSFSGAQILSYGGTAALPAVSIVGDNDTGMYSTTPNVLSFTTGGSERFRIRSDGSLSVTTASYDTLVTDDDDIPNKKYVDDLVSSGTVIPSNVPEIHTTLGAAKTGDIGVVAGEVFIYNGSSWVQIYPAVYA